MNYENFFQFLRGQNKLPPSEDKGQADLAGQQRALRSVRQAKQILVRGAADAHVNPVAANIDAGADAQIAAEHQFRVEITLVAEKLVDRDAALDVRTDGRIGQEMVSRTDTLLQLDEAQLIMTLRIVNRTLGLLKVARLAPLAHEHHALHAQRPGEAREQTVDAETQLGGAGPRPIEG